MRTSLLIILSLLVFACNTQEAPETEAEKPVTKGDIQGSWNLISWQGESLPAAQADSFETITLSIDVASKKISGNSGCNEYTATFTKQEKLLTISDPALARMLCPKPVNTMQRELAYLALLTGVQSYEQLDERLILYSVGKSKLIFER